ncbi:hypothetical protein GALL_389110 [mine drainage metagenome]|uniref:Uncharacterized protein n=1 Tax=mine drainage metagenome TaxID=410659 RepID=A0A1J5Q855_9ZZZZ
MDDGIFDLSDEGAGTSSCTCLNATWIAVSPTNGWVPTNISKSMMPTAYTSLRASAMPRSTCSGDRYATVPRREPASAVMVEALDSALARPKSATLTWPSAAMITFSGLTSRCTMPARCAAPSALKTASVISSAAVTSRGPSSRMISRSVRPSTNSITRKTAGGPP